MPLLSTDPLDVLLDADGDIDLTGGGQFSRGLPGVVQAVRMVAQFRLRELFHNLSIGLPYYERDGVTEDQAILGQPYDAGKIAAAFRAAALTVPAVLAITQLSSTFDPETRAVAVTWSASTTFGDTVPDTLQVSP